MVDSAEEVYCTLLMSDSYLPGAAVLAHSLRDCGTKKKIAVLVTLDTLLYSTIAELKLLFDYIIPVERIANPNLENLVRLDRLDLRFAFTKIALWEQKQFRKIVYIDADVVALRAPDELFDLDVPFAASPDIGWPDCFNSGVMLLHPNLGDFKALETMASSGESFDGADQGLLNQYFASRPWHRLSFAYNCTPSSSYQYEPAYRHFRSNISMTHFIGKAKPWQNGRSALSASDTGAYKELLGCWWSVYDRHYNSSALSAYGALSGRDPVVQKFVKDPIEDTSAATASRAMSQSFNLIPSTSNTASQTSSQTSSVQGIPLSPPHKSWDATRSGPPTFSKPEAGSFPDQHYTMSTDSTPYKAPTSYPAPPNDMYYPVPEQQPTFAQRPTPIFPWEKEKSPVKPKRVFPGMLPFDYDQTSTELSTNDDASTIMAFSPGTSQTAFSPDLLQSSLQGASVEFGSTSDPWNKFARTNAWDNDTSIDHYVRQVKQSQVRRDKGPAIFGTSSEKDFAPGAADPSTTSQSRRQRRESLILTDFPTDVERPSLPVTPAPRRRPTFWGDERDDDGDLPGAEGVPEQADWNPMAQLEKLRQSALVDHEELNTKIASPMPQRSLPESSTFLDQPTSPVKFESPEDTSAVLHSQASHESSHESSHEQPAIASSQAPTFKEIPFVSARTTMPLSEHDRHTSTSVGTEAPAATTTSISPAAANQPSRTVHSATTATSAPIISAIPPSHLGSPTTPASAGTGFYNSTIARWIQNPERHEYGLDPEQPEYGVNAEHHGYGLQPERLEGLAGQADRGPGEMNEADIA